MSRRAHLVRPDDAEHVSVDFVELFFDLVYVFAVTQLSHFLLAHHDPRGLAEAVILFLAVWWAWTFTTWATNWLDPSRVPVRLMVFAIMMASLVMSASLPAAFGDKGWWFAGAYVLVQLGRTLFVVWVVWNHRRRLAISLMRVALWFAASAPLWIAGALAEPDARIWWWGAAIALEYGAPLVHFRVPVLGRSQTRDYAVSGAHMAERCALLIIIALGEGILITGATFADQPWTGAGLAAALAAFLGSVAMWWVYFDVGMRRGAEKIEAEADSGRIARNAYTYAHLPIVAGIIVGAVGDEMLMEHPIGHAEPLFLWTLLGGSALFLAGTMLFKRLTARSRFWPLSHLVGLLLFALAGVWAMLAHPAPLGVAAVTVAILLTVAVWEWGSFHGGWVARGVPVPGFIARYAAWRRAAADGDDKAVSQSGEKG